jgi:D-glycero-D-manno-heptose 1,7-bisphosphate phosphatase
VSLAFAAFGERMSMSKSSRPAIFFDRDGVLNVDHGYVVDPSKLNWMPQAKEAVLKVNQHGFAAVVISNQSGIGRGMFDAVDVDRFHGVMQAQLAEIGARMDAFYYCPFVPEAVFDEFRHPDHPDRKPNPGLILRAAQEMDLDLARSAMIGDRTSDVEAAQRAGVRGVLYRGEPLDDLVATLIG